MAKHQKTVLENGLRIVTESHPLSKSFCFGAWLVSGTRDEPPGMEGISHFIEHLVFKGTRKRNAFQIAASLENLGGDLNAYTTKEYTCYHGLVLKDHAGIAIDVITDLVTGMKIKEKDFDLEKNVILQEMSMSLENHEEVIYETFFEKVYHQHPLGQRILGSESSIQNFSLKDVRSYYQEKYRPENMIFSASGNLKHAEIVKKVERAILAAKLPTRSPKKKKLSQSNKLQQIVNQQIPTPQKRIPPPWKTVRECIDKESEQIHILIGLPVPSVKDQKRFESFILNAYLGGGMTSSLFQSVREKKGLVYNIQSTLNTHEDSGCILIYASTERANVKPVVEIIMAELRKIKKNGIKKDFVEQFRTQIAGQILLGSDDMENRMSSLGINEMVFEEYRSVEKVIADVKRVSSASMKSFIAENLEFKNLSGLLLGSRAHEFKGWWNDVLSKN